MNFLGKHITLDIVGFNLSPQIGGEFILNLLRDSVKLSTCHEVHHKLVILGDTTPPGFTSVVLIDESHLTAHCYSDKELLAIDIFTCGNSNPVIMINYIIEKITEKLPNIKYIKSDLISRFPCDVVI